MAAIVDRKRFGLGVALGAGFLAVLPLIFAPVLGGETLLAKADRIFSSLAKGSTRFGDDLRAAAARFEGQSFCACLRLEGDTEEVQALLCAAGCECGAAEGGLEVRGDLGRLAAAVARDAEDMYRNDGEALRRRYGLDGRRALVTWWRVLSEMDRQAKADGRLAEDGLLVDLLTKGVEPGYNFYGLPPERVRDHVPLVAGLLAGYVAYTIWCGFSIYLIFQGLGLKAGRPKAPPDDGAHPV